MQRCSPTVVSIDDYGAHESCSQIRLARTLRHVHPAGRFKFTAHALAGGDQWTVPTPACRSNGGISRFGGYVRPSTYSKGADIAALECSCKHPCLQQWSENQIVMTHAHPNSGPGRQRVVSSSRHRRCARPRGTGDLGRSHVLAASFKSPDAITERAILKATRDASAAPRASPACTKLTTRWTCSATWRSRVVCS